MGCGVCHSVWALFGSGKPAAPAPILNNSAGWIVADLPLGAMPRFEYATRLKAAGTVLMRPLEQFLVGLRFSPDDEKGAL